MIATNGVTKPSMNEANERDPFNNNSYGTLLDSGYKMVSLPVLDVADFNERIIRAYEEGWGEKDLPADLSVARSLIPAGTATLRDFSNISPEIPEYIPENCTACMDCVTECPDTAILGKVLSETELEEKLKGPGSGAAFESAASYGRVLPDLWMEHATGKPVVAEPMLQATEAALAALL